ncbi:MAG: hypothetical protein V6S10_05220 [Candidatus Methanoglobus sp.]
MSIVHALTRGMRWGSLAFEPADEGKGVKHLNAGSSQLKSWSSSQALRWNFKLSIRVT